MTKKKVKAAHKTNYSHFRQSVLSYVLFYVSYKYNKNVGYICMHTFVFGNKFIDNVEICGRINEYEYSEINIKTREFNIYRNDCNTRRSQLFNSTPTLSHTPSPLMTIKVIYSLHCFM